MPSLLNRYWARWNPRRAEKHDYYIVRIDQNIFYYYLLLLSYCCYYAAMRVRAGTDAGG